MWGGGGGGQAWRQAGAQTPGPGSGGKTSQGVVEWGCLPGWSQLGGGGGEGGQILAEIIGAGSGGKKPGGAPPPPDCRAPPPPPHTHTWHCRLDPLWVVERVEQRPRDEAHQEHPTLRPHALHGRSVQGDQAALHVKGQEVWHIPGGACPDGGGDQHEGCKHTREGCGWTRQGG